MNVGLIGCGRIAMEAHLPAYKKYGVKVVGVCDIIKEKAKKAAFEYDIPLYSTNFLDIAKMNQVEILDIATRPFERELLLRKLLKFKKPLLVQKPVTYEYEKAVQLYYDFKKANVPIAINHNARWSPVQLRISQLIKNGILGNIHAIHHVNRFNENVEMWYTDHPDYMFLDHGLHYIDLVRIHTRRMPCAVSAITGKAGKQNAKCPLIYSINMRYDIGEPLVVSLYFNNNSPPSSGFSCDWFIDGTKSSIHATLNSILIISSNGMMQNKEELTGDWIPEGFWGTYQEFIQALRKGEEPSHSLKDHLQSLKIAHAAAISARNKGRWINLKQDDFLL